MSNSNNNSNNSNSNNNNNHSNLRRVSFESSASASETTTKTRTNNSATAAVAPSPSSLLLLSSLELAAPAAAAPQQTKTTTTTKKSIMMRIIGTGSCRNRLLRSSSRIVSGSSSMLMTAAMTTTTTTTNKKKQKYYHEQYQQPPLVAEEQEPTRMHKARKEEHYNAMPSQSKSPPALHIEYPEHTDILFGRGWDIQNRPANLFFRRVLESHLTDYNKLESKKVKTIFAGAITSELQERHHCRFLMKDPTHAGGWHEVTDTVARQKVSSGFRDIRKARVKHKTNSRGEQDEGIKVDQAVEVCIIGGGPVGTEIARLLRIIGIPYHASLVIDPRGCLLAAPTGYVSKVLLNVSKQIPQNGTSRGSKHTIWEHAEDALAKTANRALNLTRKNFAETATDQNKNDGDGDDATMMPHVEAGYAKFTTVINSDIDDNDITGEGDGAKYIITSTSTTSSSVVSSSSSSSEKKNTKHKNTEETTTITTKPHIITIAAKTVFITTGSKSTRIPTLPWNSSLSSETFLYDSDSIQTIGRIPEHLVIQGGGVIGVEYAFIFRRLGSKVTLCLREMSVLEGKAVDSSISKVIGKRLSEAGVQVRYGDGDFTNVEVPSATTSKSKSGSNPKAKEMETGMGIVTLKTSHDVLECDAILSALGRGGCTDMLDVESAGLTTRSNSAHIVVDHDMRAVSSSETLSRVFVAGDVAGEHAIVKPAGLLSTGLAQAHLAVRSAFPTKWKDRFPLQGKRKTQGAAFERYPAIALWIEDGIGYAGLTEEQAHDEYGTDHVGTTTVQYENCVKACVEPRPSDEYLKLIFHMDSGVILGCHIFGKDATEMINHPASFINRDQTIWDALHAVPPAVTYGEIFIKAAQKASYCFTKEKDGQHYI